MAADSNGGLSAFWKGFFDWKIWDVFAIAAQANPLYVVSLVVFSLLFAGGVVALLYYIKTCKDDNYRNRELFVDMTRETDITRINDLRSEVRDLRQHINSGDVKQISETPKLEDRSKEP